MMKAEMIYSTAHEYPDTLRGKNTVENGLSDTVYYVYWKIQEKAPRCTVADSVTPWPLCHSVVIVF